MGALPMACQWQLGKGNKAYKHRLSSAAWTAIKELDFEDRRGHDSNG